MVTTIEVIDILLYVQANPDAIYREVLKPLSAAIDFLNDGKDEQAKKNINYAEGNLLKYQGTVENHVFSDAQWRIETTKALLKVSPENIDKAYELASIKRILELSKSTRAQEVKERLTKLATDAKTAGGGQNPLIKTYRDAITSSINDPENIIPTINKILSALGYKEPET